MFSVNELQDNRVLIPVTIANGQSLSGVVDMGGCVPGGLIMDPTGWTAASITFAVSDTLAFTNSYNLFNAALTEITIGATVTSGQAIAFGGNMIQGFLNILRPWRYLKVRSGTSGTPVAQGAQRNLQLVAIPFLA